MSDFPKLFVRPDGGEFLVGNPVEENRYRQEGCKPKTTARRVEAPAKVEPKAPAKDDK